MSEILKICNENRIPVIPFGTGTGLEGGVNAIVVRLLFGSEEIKCFQFLSFKHACISQSFFEGWRYS